MPRIPARFSRRVASTGVDSESVSLAELRSLNGITQAEMASELSVSQAGVLKTERAADPRLSTLRRYVDALGQRLGVTSQLEVVVQLGADRTYVLDGLAGGITDPITPAPLEGNTTMMTTTAATRSSAETSGVWRLRAWDDAELEQLFIAEGFIAMSDDEIDDLTDWPSDTQLRERLSLAFPTRTPQAIGTFCGYWRAFRIDMQVGDLVVVPLVGRRVGVGEITSDYHYESKHENRRVRHRRSVRWLYVTNRAALDEDIRRVVNAPGTICRVKGNDVASRLQHQLKPSDAD